MGFLILTNLIFFDAGSHAIMRLCIRQENISRGSNSHAERVIPNVPLPFAAPSPRRAGAVQRWRRSDRNSRPKRAGGGPRLENRSSKQAGFLDIPVLPAADQVPVFYAPIPNGWHIHCPPGDINPCVRIGSHSHAQEFGMPPLPAGAPKWGC